VTSPDSDTTALAARLGTVSVVSTFPPSKDGIARYTGQFVTALADAGAKVNRIGLARGEGGGDHVVDIARGTRFLRVVRRTPRADALLVMWHPAYLTGGRQLPRIAAVVSLAVGFRLRRTIVLQHEPDDDLLSGMRGPRRITRRAEEYLREMMWKGATEVWFHSEYERSVFLRRYPAVATNTVLDLVAHGAAFIALTQMTRAEARKTLGIPADELMFLCPGFLSVHKGVDRVIEAFRDAGASDSRLWIVGSAMKRGVETERHIAELHRLVQEVDNVEIRERYVDDREFDLWLRASDVVILAYRSSASSGVIPRAQLLGARIIGSGVGGTAEQLRPSLDIVASTGEALARAIRGIRVGP
jgi:glycosyltransferase involved in cell wall biosynthesis